MLRSYVPAPGGSVRGQRAPKLIPTGRFKTDVPWDGPQLCRRRTWCRQTAWRGPGPRRVLPGPHCHPDPARVEGFGKVTRRWLAPLTQPRRLVMGNGGVRHARARAQPRLPQETAFIYPATPPRRMRVVSFFVRVLPGLPRDGRRGYVDGNRTGLMCAFQMPGSWGPSMVGGLKARDMDGILLVAVSSLLLL